MEIIGIEWVLQNLEMCIGIWPLENFLFNHQIEHIHAKYYYSSLLTFDTSSVPRL